MFLTVFAGLVFLFLMLFQCKPLSFFWNRMAHHPVVNIEGEGSCINMEIIVAMTYVYSVFAAMCDFTVGILPIFLVQTLQMKRRTKILVAGILGMACVYVHALFLPLKYTANKFCRASSAVIVRIPFVETFNDLDDFLCTLLFHFLLRPLASKSTNPPKMPPFTLPTGRILRLVSVLPLAASQLSVLSFATGSAHTQINHIPLGFQQNLWDAMVVLVGSGRSL